MNYGLEKGVVWTCCCFFNPYTQRIDCVIRAVIGHSSNDDGNVNEENGKKKQ